MTKLFIAMTVIIVLAALNLSTNMNAAISAPQQCAALALAIFTAFVPYALFSAYVKMKTLSAINELQQSLQQSRPTE